MSFNSNYYEKSSNFNWLDAMSSNRAFFDPRTIGAHHGNVRSCQPQLSGSEKVNPRALAALPSTNQRVCVSEWVHEISISMEGPSSPSNNTDNKIDQDNENDDRSDAKSESSSTVCTSIHSGYQIEAVPAYSQQKPSDTLFDLRNQICHPETSKKVSKRAVCATFADDDYMYSPYLQIEVPSMTLSSTVTASSLTGTTEELNIGKLIAAKVRQAAAHSVAACEKLKRKFKL